ncbi:hypothetical protein [Segatella salivae]|jgi:hypothetical protein|uniref:hypothetical protein n=1 Tax=Segatella salivae TaxID=228604 RepID=UPI0028DC6E9D|nr:hypothetical protein [Segatella salivae]
MMMKRKKNYLEPWSILQPIEWTSSLLAGTGTGHNVGFTPGVGEFEDGGTEDLDGET